MVFFITTQTNEKNIVNFQSAEIGYVNDLENLTV